MANPNKAKGDRAERAVLAVLKQFDNDARRTRPGRLEDQGDIHALNTTWQVKDVARPLWRDWLTQLDQQVERSPYRRGILVWKLRGYGGKPAKWLAVMELEQMCELLEETNQ